MSWQETLCDKLATQLKRRGIKEWLLRLDSFDTERIEVAGDGNSFHQGESTCLSIAFWRGSGTAITSFLLPAGSNRESAKLVAQAVNQLANENSVHCSADSIPRFQEGSATDWQGEWSSLCNRWQPLLFKSVVETNNGAKQLTLSLERRRIFLRDHERRTRRIARHSTNIVISCRGGPKERGAWTMTVPLDTPEPGDLRCHIKRVQEHARLRACCNSTESGTGPVILQSTAVAQILAMLKVSSDADNSKLFPIVWRRDPGSGSDVGFADDLRSQESNSMLMRFVQDGSIVPEPCRLWISPGTFSTLRLKRVGLSIRHFDELLYRGSLKPFAGIASGEVIDGNSSRTVSRLRLDLSWRAVRRALLDSTKRGHSTLGIRFGETGYWVPPVSLGECSWKHQ